MTETLTEQQLLESARRHGCKVSRDQLKRWRQAELIPRPVQTHPAGRRGSEAAYPAGTLTQLLAVCELRKRYKKLDRIRFELWWSGRYAGPMEPVRSFLTAELKGLLGELREHRDRFTDPFDAAEAAVASPALKSRNPMIRAMRRLAKSDENLSSAAHAMFLLLFGGDVDWDFDTQTGAAILINAFGPEVMTDVGASEPSLRELVEAATGVKRARTDELSGGLRLLSPEADIVEAMQTATRERVFDLDDPGWAIRGASEDRLDRARQVAHLVTEGFAAVAKIIAAQYGRDHAGLSPLAGLNTADPTLAAVAVQWSLCLPLMLSTDEERTHVADTLEALEANATQLACLQLFLQEHPHYAFLSKPGAGEHLTAEERSVLRTTLHDFVTRHPECSRFTDLRE